MRHNKTELHILPVVIILLFIVIVLQSCRTKQIDSKIETKIVSSVNSSHEGKQAVLMLKNDSAKVNKTDFICEEITEYKKDCTKVVTKRKIKSVYNSASGSNTNIVSKYETKDSMSAQTETVKKEQTKTIEQVPFYYKYWWLLLWFIVAICVIYRFVIK